MSQPVDVVDLLKEELYEQLQIQLIGGGAEPRGIVTHIHGDISELYEAVVGPNWLSYATVEQFRRQSHTYQRDVYMDHNPWYGSRMEWGSTLRKMEDDVDRLWPYPMETHYKFMLEECDG